MADRRARRAVAALLVASTVAIAGCSGVPTSGEVTAVRPVEAAQDRAELDRGPRNSLVFVRFPPPSRRASPEEIVRGFLDAHADLEPNLRVARQYLAPGTAWDPRAGVSVFSGEKAVAEPTGSRTEQVATVTVTRVATVTRGGEYVPRRDAAPTVLRLRMRLVDGEYRLFDVPPGLVLSESGLERAFRRSVVYFPDPARRRLVPDAVFLPRGAASDVTSVATRAVSGPTSWLAPATRTAIPLGTGVDGAVSVLRGVATLNLSRQVDDVAPDARAALVAQLVWTLTEPGLGVDAVRVLAGGRPVVLPGGSTREPQRRSDWARFDPDPTSDTPRLYFVRDGQLQSLERAETTSVRDDPERLRAIAITRSGALLGAVRDDPAGTQSLLVGALSGELATRVTARGLRSPTWRADGDEVWVVRVDGSTSQVVAVPSVGGPVRSVTVDGLAGRTVEQVSLSPDGARAVLVLRRGTTHSAWTARVEQRRDGGALAGLRPLRPVAGAVRAVGWESSGRLLVADGSRLLRIDPDGFDPTEVPSDGLPSGAVDHVAGGPTADLVVEIAGRLWRRAAGWRVAAAGSSPAYAG